MAKHIIAAIRRQAHLRTVTRTIAIEIAQRMSSSGIGRIAYHFLANKAACSIRTAIRHVQKLVAMGLFRKRHTHTAAGFGWNVYEYIGPRLQEPAPPATTRYAILAERLPGPAREEEKSLSLREEIAQLRKGMRWWTEGSEQYAACLERVTMLTHLEQG